ncbi:MAG: class I SAM-dependent methyltransferase [Solirubrobacterales bacterium]
MTRIKATQSVYDHNGQELFAGMWDPKMLAAILTRDDPGFWQGRRVLDIGANTGGLSVELARMGAIVTVAEPDPFRNTLAQTHELLLRLREDEQLDLTIERKTLFECHTLPRHDVVLCLGLMYHFRYPQMLIDYLSSLRPEFLFISSQTHPSTELALFNRAGILSKDHFPDDLVLTGWHPTRPLLERMLKWAGFIEVESLTKEPFDFPRKPPGATNSAYYKARLSNPVDPETLRTVFYPR